MNKQRPKMIAFRVSEDEYAKIQALVAASGKTQQEYLLSSALNKELINLDGLKELMPELKRQGNNLNQISKRLNARGYIDYRHELPDALAEVRNVWQSLRLYLQEQK